jgi:hypothetical protein
MTNFHRSNIIGVVLNKEIQGPSFLRGLLEVTKDKWSRKMEKVHIEHWQTYREVR